MQLARHPSLSSKCRTRKMVGGVQYERLRAKRRLIAMSGTKALYQTFYCCTCSRCSVFISYRQQVSRSTLLFLSFRSQQVENAEQTQTAYSSCHVKAAQGTCRNVMLLPPVKGYGKSNEPWDRRRFGFVFMFIAIFLPIAAYHHLSFCSTSLRKCL